MGRRIPAKQVEQMEHTMIEGLSQDVRDVLGHELEDSFTGILYGDSGNGKTNETAQLLLVLKQYPQLYISWEEAHGSTVKKLIQRHKLTQHIPQLQFSDGETFAELVPYLRRKKSPKVIVFDSVQFSGWTIPEYKAFKREFVFGKQKGKRKIVLFISHVDDSYKPEGALARLILRDAHIKVKVKGFVAIVTSRFENTKNGVIWEEGARREWGDDYDDIVNKRPIKKGKKKVAPKKKTAPKKKATEPQDTEGE